MNETLVFPMYGKGKELSRESSMKSTEEHELLVVVDGLDLLKVKRIEDGQFLLIVDKFGGGVTSFLLTAEQAAKVAKALTDEAP
jgi:hypothetical protein